MKNINKNLLKGRIINNRFEVTDDRAGNDHYDGHFGDGKFGLDKKSGEEVFIKTIVFGKPINRQAGESAIQQMERELHAFRHEARLMSICLEHNLKRVTRMLDFGEVQKDDGALEFAYMVFEKAECNGHIDNLKLSTDEFRFKLQLLKDVCIGLFQLHQRSIVHQDIKPSNILKVFEQNIERAKVADLGRASIKSGKTMAHDSLDFACQGIYAAPDRSYRMNASNWDLRRTSSDLYLFGSLIWQYLTEGQSLTGEWMSRLSEPLKPGNFNDEYSQILPHIIGVFEDIFSEAFNNCENEIEKELLVMIKELTHPDPKNRGAPTFKNRIDKYSLQPFISRLERLLKTYEANLRIANA